MITNHFILQKKPHFFILNDNKEKKQISFFKNSSKYCTSGLKFRGEGHLPFLPDAKPSTQCSEGAGKRVFSNISLSGGRGHKTLPNDSIQLPN